MNKLKCLFGYHLYNIRCDVHPSFQDSPALLAPEDIFKYVKAYICGACGQSIRLVDYTLFDHKVFDILEKTSDKLIVVIPEMVQPIFLKKS